jgi:hypothetical protein
MLQGYYDDISVVRNYHGTVMYVLCKDYVTSRCVLRCVITMLQGYYLLCCVINMLRGYYLLCCVINTLRGYYLLCCVKCYEEIFVVLCKYYVTNRYVLRCVITMLR